MEKMFIKSIFACLLIILISYFDSFGAMYKPGTYKASAIGKESKGHSGIVELEVEVSESKIESINILSYEQSMDHRKYGPLVKKAQLEIPSSIINKQTVNVDGIVKATISSDAIKLAVAKALLKATIKYTPGTYKGFATGKKGKGYDGNVEVEVKVSESRIEDIKVITYQQSIDHKRYGPSVKKAKDIIPDEIIKKQSLDVDAIAKATISSIAIQLAVANALEKARK